MSALVINSPTSACTEQYASALEFYGKLLIDPHPQPNVICQAGDSSLWRLLLGCLKSVNFSFHLQAGDVESDLQYAERYSCQPLQQAPVRHR